MTQRSTSFLKTDALRLNALLERLGVNVEEQKRLCITQSILRAYCEPHRIYHNASHIIDMLELFDTEWFQRESLLHLAQNSLVRDELEAAIWWHDAVYQVAIPEPGLSNERASAYWAYAALMQGGAHLSTATAVRDFVLATDHHASVFSPDRAAFLSPERIALLTDLDLAILGADEYRFPFYELHISAEYGHVPYLDYLNGRAYFLQNFLDSRDYIYQTPQFRARYEYRAQDNVKGLIAQLKSHSEELERHGNRPNENT